MWAAPGRYRATYQPDAPDADHSPALWTSLAQTFRNNPNVILGVWGEPAVGASCFANGGICGATYGPRNAPYRSAGSKQAVRLMRAAGYRGVIAVPGVAWANDLSAWLANEPQDPLHQLVAEAHIYGGQVCASVSCFNQTLLPVAQRVPLLFGETGENVPGTDCSARAMRTHPRVGRQPQRLLGGVDVGHLGHLRCADLLLRRHAGEPVRRLHPPDPENPRLTESQPVNLTTATQPALSVPFLDLTPQTRAVRDQALADIGALCDANAFINGPVCATFEEAFGVWVGAAHTRRGRQRHRRAAARDARVGPRARVGGALPGQHLRRHGRGDPAGGADAAADRRAPRRLHPGPRRGRGRRRRAHRGDHAGASVRPDGRHPHGPADRRAPRAARVRGRLPGPRRDA